MTQAKRENHLGDIEKVKRSEGLRLFFLVATLVFASRLPFIDDLDAGLGDSSFLSRMGWIIQPASPILMNCTSALLCGVAIAFFTLSIKAIGGNDSVLAGLGLACIPVVYINSISSADFLWAFPFLMASLYLVLLQRTLLAGICLGLAIGLGTTLVTMAIPLGLLLFRGGLSTKNLRHFLVFFIAAAVIAALVFYPDYIKDRWNFLDYHPCRFPLKLMIKIVTLESWGAIGLVALAVAALSLFFQKKRQNEFLPPTPVNHLIVIASVTAIILYLVISISTPFKTSCLIPILPFLILFLERTLSRKMFAIFCCMLILSPFFVTLVQANQEPRLFSDLSTAVSVRTRRFYVDFLQGPILFAAKQRKAATRLSGTVNPRGGRVQSGFEQRPMWVTGYYPVWSLGLTGSGVNPMHPRDVKWAGITHAVHFGIGPQTTSPYWSPMVSNTQGNRDSIDLVHAGSWVYPIGSYNMPDSLYKYTSWNGVRLLLSCGGIWGDQGTAMSFITQDSTRTQTFGDALLGFAQRHRYSGGIEIDWESSVTRDGMSRLVRILRRGLNRWSPHGELLIAVVNGLEDNYDISLKDSVDQYNIMLYDMHGSASVQGGPDSWSDVTALDAPLYPPSPELPTLRRWNWNYDGTLDGIANVTSLDG